jgi:hypothetical protein
MRSRAGRTEQPAQSLQPADFFPTCKSWAMVASASGMIF